MLPNPLTSEDGQAILEAYFSIVREAFIERGLAFVRDTEFEVRDWVHDSPRHYAATTEDGRLVIAAPELALLPPETIEAILAHEFGHVTDYRYPGEWRLADDELVRLPRIPKRLLDHHRARIEKTEDELGARSSRQRREDKAGLQASQTASARLQAWMNRDPDTVEFTADAIAEHVTGRKIGYCGPCLLQCFDRGRRRPRGLR